MAQIFLDLGYKVRDELRFPTKKLRALWFSPPDHLLDMEGSEAEGPLPRIFISEIIVSKLSREAQVTEHPPLALGFCSQLKHMRISEHRLLIKVS